MSMNMKKFVVEFVIMVGEIKDVRMIGLVAFSVFSRFFEVQLRIQESKATYDKSYMKDSFYPNALCNSPTRRNEQFGK